MHSQWGIQEDLGEDNVRTMALCQALVSYQAFEAHQNLGFSCIFILPRTLLERVQSTQVALFDRTPSSKRYVRCGPIFLERRDICK